ncbi:MAG: FHA domain-containing protein [Planctomycetota bacterium]|nr:MAG: FHA domain-containing protein [Planctomycetota bacterium]
MPNALEIVVERDNVQRVVSLEGDRVQVGRGKDCELRLEDPLASRNHCRFERLGSEVFVVDLDSANGTWVDGVRVQRRPLSRGDVVRVGSTTLRLTGGVIDALSAIESTQTQQLPRERDILQTLLAVARALEEEDKLERVAAMLIDAAVSLTRAERGFVFLVDQGRTQLAMGRNFAREPIPGPEQKVSQTLLEKTLNSEAPLLLQDAASDGEFAGVASLSDLGVRSLLAVPLRHGSETIGILLVDHRLASGAFLQDEKELLAGLASVASTALGAARMRRKLQSLKRRVSSLQRELGKRVTVRPEANSSPRNPQGRFGGIIGASAAMERMFAAMDRVMNSDVSVLIQGESGTGKEMVAQALHFGGPRAAKNFVTENCGALPDTLLESELFGHVKGAYTGATRDRVGRFEEAHGGTLFLDEVGEMSSAMQARLLRALQEGEVRRLGSDEVRKVDVRVICATNRDLVQEVEQGGFREDLYYRIKVVLLELPPLRQRQGDVALLAEHFLTAEAETLGRQSRELGAQALNRLEAYSWPGNVRQLRNEVRRLTLLGEGPIQMEELSAEIREEPVALHGDPGVDRPLPERIAAMEQAAIREALKAASGNRSQAAKRLGISRFALLRKIEKYNLLPEVQG